MLANREEIDSGMTSAKAYEKCFVKNKRDLELEHIIAMSSEYSYYYAKNIINGRFYKAESVIAQDPKWAYHYAKYVIDDAFKIAHQSLIKDSDWGKIYVNFLLEKKYFDHSIIEWLI